MRVIISHFSKDGNSVSLEMQQAARRAVEKWKSVGLSRLELITDGSFPVSIFKNYVKGTEANYQINCYTETCEGRNWGSELMVELLKSVRDEPVLWLKSELLLSCDIMNELSDATSSSSIFFVSDNDTTLPNDEVPYSEFFQLSEQIMGVKIVSKDIPACCFCHQQQGRPDDEAAMRAKNDQANENLADDFIMTIRPVCEFVSNMPVILPTKEATSELSAFLPLLSQRILYDQMRHKEIHQWFSKAAGTGAAVLIVRGEGAEERMVAEYSAFFSAACHLVLGTDGFDAQLTQAISSCDLVIAFGQRASVMARQAIQRAAVDRQQKRQISLALVLSVDEMLLPGITGLDVILDDQRMRCDQAIAKLIIVKTAEMAAVQRLKLYSDIGSAAMNNSMLSFRHEQWRQWWNKQILATLTSDAPGDDSKLLMLALRNQVLKDMMEADFCDGVARELAKRTGMPKVFAMQQTVIAWIHYLDKALSGLKLQCPRQTIGNAVDEILITLNLLDSTWLVDWSNMLLCRAELQPLSDMSEELAEDILQSLAPQELCNAQVKVSACDLAASFCAYAQTPDMFDREPAKTKTQKLFFPLAWSSLNQLLDGARMNYLADRLRQHHGYILSQVMTLCDASEIPLSLLRLAPNVDKDDQSGLWSATAGYTVLLQAQDVKRFRQAFVDQKPSTFALDDQCPCPDFFVSLRAYLPNTRMQTDWNLPFFDQQEISIRIVATQPYNKKANAGSGRGGTAEGMRRSFFKRVSRFLRSLLPRELLRRLATRVGRDSRADGTKRQTLMETNANILRLRPYRSVSVPYVASPVAVQTASYEPRTDRLNGVYNLTTENEALSFHQLGNINVPKQRGLISKLLNVAKKGVIFIIRGFMRLIDELKKRKNALRPTLRRVYVRCCGQLRALGLCIAPASKELRAYRNRYRGQRCFLIGNGPSLRAEDLDMLRNEVTFGCNFIHKIYKQTPWRPTFHCLSDSSTVRTAGVEIVSNQDCNITTMILRDFVWRNMPLKSSKALVAPSLSTEDYSVSRNFLAYHYISHATVMSMMIECAMYMGFKDIYLIGVDASTSSDKGGNFTANYFSPEMREKLHLMKLKAIQNYDKQARREEIAKRQKMVYEKLAVAAEQRNVHIYNATRGGALEAFPRVDLDDLLKEGK